MSKADDYILEKRREGYSCSAIAASLVVVGLSDRELTRQAIYKRIVRLDPSLAGGVISSLGCRRQIRRHEVTND